ncbi:uncharacterized protein LOC127749649 [Frankliniella occidentalis]|uniref:Uncharacterized protein LOC127749649 n=1 Tax=Frankliniella occidentalis TaxID=133901 RepID=A0A9C6U7I1_FRAOC|nr:uncharacterized protein LOC127749649 [Frankliniella occidentalis]
MRVSGSSEVEGEKRGMSPPPERQRVRRACNRRLRRAGAAEKQGRGERTAASRVYQSELPTLQYLPMEMLLLILGYVGVWDLLRLLTTAASQRVRNAARAAFLAAEPISITIGSSMASCWSVSEVNEAAIQKMLETLKRWILYLEVGGGLKALNHVNWLSRYDRAVQVQLQTHPELKPQWVKFLTCLLNPETIISHVDCTAFDFVTSPKEYARFGELFLEKHHAHLMTVDGKCFWKREFLDLNWAKLQYINFMFTKAECLREMGREGGEEEGVNFEGWVVDTIIKFVEIVPTLEMCVGGPIGGSGLE